MASPRLLLLVPTTTYRADDFMAAAARLGVDVNVAVTVATEAERVLARADAPDLLTLDFSDPERAAAQAVAFARRHPVAAVVPVDDQTTVAAAAVAEALGLPHNSVEAARVAQNKFHMREAFARSGVPGPTCRRVSLADDVNALAAETTYPCVLKPEHLSGSRGVIRADTPEEFRAAFARIARLLAREDVPGRADVKRHLLIEPFIAGPEVALEGLLADGELMALALFDKPDPLDGPFFEETIYVTPSRIGVETQRAIVECVAAAARALGVRDGPIHAELRLTPQGPCVIEVAARSIGGLCARTLRFGAGVSLEELIIRHAMGLEIDSYEREREPSGVMMLPIPRAGVLRAVHGLAAARNLPGIEEIALTIRLGDEVEPLPEGGTYLGFIFARAQTVDAVETALRRAHDTLDIVIEP